MKYALLADVHSNLEALEACLEHARQQGAERFVFLGDLVGYNADPVAVVERVQAQVAAGALVVQGNHDAAAAGESSDYMSGAAAAAIDWTRRQLSPEQLDFLAALPLKVREGDACFVHASAAAPERWGYIYDGLRAAASLDAAGTTYVFCGHVHEPVLYYQGADQRPQPFQPSPGVAIPVPRHRRWLAIVGACGQPRDGLPAACYAVFEPERALLTYFRVPYDYETTARKVLAAGLPAELAQRLLTGD